MDLIKQYTKLVTRILIGLLAVILTFSLVEFIILVARVVLTHRAAYDFSDVPVDKTNLFITEVQGLIGAVLLISILIELIHSLMQDLKSGSTSYVSVITEIALIAIVRHLLTMDIAHMEGRTLAGLAALIFVLGLFYLTATKHLPDLLKGRYQSGQPIAVGKGEDPSPEA